MFYNIGYANTAAMFNSRHDMQHNDIQHNDTQQNAIQDNDI